MFLFGQNVIMPSRVSPTETTVHGNQEMPTAISDRTTTGDAPFIVEISERENANEHFLKAIDEVYSPLLKLMKLFGIYFGDATLKRLAYTSRGHSGKHIFLHQSYCVLLVCCYWFNFIIAATGIFFQEDIYLSSMFSLWCLFISLNGTVCLVVLPLTGRKTRFEKFLDRVFALVKNVNLEKVKEKSRKGLIMSCVILIMTPAIILVAVILLKLNTGAFKPWNIWFGFSVLSPLFLIIGVGAWLLPILFFCITSLILEELFADLLKRMSLFNSTLNDLDSLKREYHNLCEAVELADKVLAPLLLVFISLYIPLLCFSFFIVVNLREDNSLLFLLENLSWLLIVAVVLGLILFFGGKVNEKVKLRKQLFVTFLLHDFRYGMLFIFIIVIRLLCLPNTFFLL